MTAAWKIDGTSGRRICSAREVSMRIRSFVPALLFLSTLACSNKPSSATLMSEDDSVELVSKSGSGQATLLVDGRRSSCVNDDVVHGSGQIPIKNLRSPSSCNSEVAVFASDNESKLLSPGWTDGGDGVKVNMAPALSIPLAIWVMYSSEPNFLTLQYAVSLDVLRATQLYDDEQCGVVFTAAQTDIHDVRQGNFPASLVDADCTQSLAAFKAVGDDSAKGKLNVYYIKTAAGNLGSACVDGTSNVILIADLRNNEVLAHELGHALSLGHPNDLTDHQGVSADNMMMSPQSTPGSLTLGQCFRANFDNGSLLVRGGIRTGRDCPHPAASASTSTPQCPALKLDP